MSRTTRAVATISTIPLLAAGIVAIPLAQPALASETVYSTPGVTTHTFDAGVERVFIEVYGAGGRGGHSPAGSLAGGNGGNSIGRYSYFSFGAAATATTASVVVGTAAGASAVSWNSGTAGILVGGGGIGGSGGPGGAGGAGGSATTSAGSSGAAGEGAGLAVPGSGGGGGVPPATGGAGGTGGGSPAQDGSSGQAQNGGAAGAGADAGGVSNGGGGAGGAGGGGGGGGGNEGGGGGGGAGGTFTTGSNSNSIPVNPGDPGSGGAGASAGAGDGEPGQNGRVTIISMNAPTATAEAGDESATITWTTPTQPVAATYQLYQDGLAVSGATTSPYTVTGLTNGTAYDFQVRALADVGAGSELRTAGNTVEVTPESAPPPPPPAPAIAPTIPKLTFDSPSLVTASVDVTGTGASLITRTMPTGGSWSGWALTPAEPKLGLPINVATGSWIEMRSKSGSGLSPITVAYARITGNPKPRGDIKRLCRPTTVGSVSYPSSTSATVNLQSLRKCAKYRVSGNDGQTYSKWKKVTSKRLPAKSLTNGTMGRMQIKAGKKRTTVWLYTPTQRNDQ